LRFSAFQLPWGSYIYAKIVAINLYGHSQESDVGNGAQILSAPLYPVQVEEYLPARLPTELGIQWLPGADDGGSPIIDYRITYVTGIDTTVIENVLSSPYTAVNLVTGSNYMFQIEARNAFSYSAPSASVYIFCADEPEKPTVLQTSVVNEVIRISWTSPYNNGNAITSYTVEIQGTDLGFYE
jgi:hypothetical protein